MIARGVEVLVAPDKFKGSATAVEVAGAVARGLARVVREEGIRQLPVADGGDGTVAAMVAAGFERVPVTVSGPTGERVATSWARRGGTAVVELADGCGLGRLSAGPQPLLASSRGLGETVVAALDAGCEEIVLAIGGSASTDGGMGMAAALGVEALDANGSPLPDGGGALGRLREIDRSGIHPGLRDAQLVVACDVDNPLTGPTGTAVVYGPQKGASRRQVRMLDSNLGRWADVVAATAGGDLRAVPGAGAAGGVGFAATALMGATLRPGIELILDLIGFDEALENASVVVTGEGALDQQTLHGKAPFGVARRAARSGIPVAAVTGRCTLDDALLAGAGIDRAYALLEIEPDPAVCMADPIPLLETLGERIARDLPPGAATVRGRACSPDRAP